MAKFPALHGESVSYAVLQYPAGPVNPPHAHPCTDELLFLCYGSPLTNSLHRLPANGLFAFPRGLVLYQCDNDAKNSAIAVSAYVSASAGIVSIPSDVFNTSIRDEIQAKSFKTDVVTNQKIKAGLKKSS